MATDPHTRSAALLASTEPDFRKGFLAMVSSMIGAQSLDELEELILQGRILEALGVVVPAATAYADLVSTGFVASGADTAASLASLTDTPVSFNQSGVNATGFMGDNRGRVIGMISQQQNEASRRAVSAEMLRGGTARQQAQALQGSFGLTGNQVLAVEKFRTNLDNLSRDALERQLRDRSFDSVIRQAINSDTPLTPTQVNRMVERYRERLLAFRAGVTAQSEALRVVNAGNLSMFQQAVDLGLIDGASIQRQWKTAGDSDVRNSHRAMNGQLRGLNEPFISGAGARLQFPGDPNAGGAETVGCRCVIETRFNPVT